MHAVRRFRVIAGCVLLAAAGSLAIRAAAQPPTPGEALSWAGPPVASATPAGRGPAGIPRASATASPDGGGPLAGLQAPLNSVLQRLNSETAHSAAGQLSVLQQLENALRDRIDQFLQWVVHRR
jgi:hypothetical protein